MITQLYIDLFCGAGGTSTGVEKARVEAEQVAKVIACVNHDPNAIASHKANHPDALHFTEDIRTLEIAPLAKHAAEMRIMYPGAKLVLWASLECTNFSKAKGGQPRDADSRTLAEHLFRYIDTLRPDYIHIENVEEFMSWGDLDAYGKPISKDAGRLYRQWVDNVKNYGYRFEHRILNAADYGAYTSRKRFFGIFAGYGLPIIWPKPTHTKNPAPGLFGMLQRWKPVREVLDLADEGTSIFDRPKPIVNATLERIYAGLVKFVAGGKTAFMLKYNSVNQQTGRHIPPSIDDPCPVVSTQSRLGVTQVKFLSKYYSGKPEHKNISIDGPAGTVKTVDGHAMVSADFLSTYYGNGYNRSVDGPAPTVTTKDRFIYVRPCFTASNTAGNMPKFIDQQFGNGKPAGTDQPLGAVTTIPKYNVVTCQCWTEQAHYLMNPQFKSPGGSIDAPCFTLIAKMDKRPPYLVTTEKDGKEYPSFIKKGGGVLTYEVYQDDPDVLVRIKEFMALYGIIDVKMRMLKIPELKQIMGFPRDYVLIGTQAEQKKYIGNAVEVNMARVICEALGNALITNQKIAV